MKNWIKFKNNCFICEIEERRKMLLNEQISAEEFEIFREKLYWRMKKESNRARLVCGRECFEELREIIRSMQDTTVLSKCKRHGCKHTEKLHKDGPCNGARCKCLGFLTEDEATPEILEAKRRYEEMRAKGEIP